MSKGCTNRNLIFLTVALRRPVKAVAYNISYVTEAMSPIKTIKMLGLG